MKAVAVCLTLVLTVCAADFLERGSTPPITDPRVKAGLLVINAMRSDGLVCDEGNGEAAASLGCGSGNKFQSVSAADADGDLVSSLEFGIKLDCSGASDWSGCANNGYGGTSVCKAFVGCVPA